MSQSQSVSFQECFSTLTDPRRRKVVYPLINVVTIANRNEWSSHPAK